MRIEEFEQLVFQAVEELPENIKEALKNVGIVVEEKPTEEQARHAGVRKDNILLGLYEGVPENVWGKSFGNHLPDKITIFKDSIELFSHDEKELKQMVKTVVRHEIGHYFGFDEEKVRKLEKKWREKK